ncbi:MAG TPA: hypothetical protein VHH91_02535, partial [Vicinamibacterales bacterium]|nr:hypothetical protein [Vicinamibacterales bacterium]
MAVEQSAAPHHIVVNRDRFGFEVLPGVLFVDPGDVCTVRNLTKYTVEVQLPPEIVRGGLRLILEPKGNAGDTRDFTVDGNVPGIYEYLVDASLADD